MTRRWSGAGLVAAVLLLAGLVAPAFAGEADALSQRAIERLDAFLEEAKRTGNQRTADLETAVGEAERAAALFDEASDEAAAARCLVEAGRAHRLLGRPQEALRRFEAAATAARELGATKILGRARMGDALTRYLNLQDYEAAKASIVEALQQLKTVGDTPLLFEAMILRGEIHQAQGDLPGAVKWVNDALALVPDDEPFTFRGYLNRSSAYFDLADREDADFAFREEMAKLSKQDAERAAAIARRQGWNHLAARCTKTASISAQKLMALELYQRDPTRRIDLHLFNPEKAGDVLVNEEWLASGGDEIPPWLLGAVRAWQKEDVSAPVRSYILGTFASMSGDDDEALASYLEAVRLLEGHYQALADPGARSTLLEPRNDFYDRPMLMLLERGRIAEAFELMEASRARVLRDLIMTREQVAIADPETRRLYTSLRELRARITDAQRRAGRATNADARSGPHREVERLEVEHAALLDRIRERSPGLLELVSARVVPLTQVSAAARDGGYDVLEYLVMHSGVIIWHIGPNGVHLRNVFIPGPPLEAKITTLRASLTNPNVAFDKRMARQLYLFLIEPILSELTTDRVVIVPHGALHEVPFQVLEDPADGRPLAERFALSYAPSAGVLEHLGAGVSLAGGRVLAVAGPDLELAGSEAETIAGLYEGSRAVSGGQATGTYVQRMCGAYDVLHVAAHARFDAREPMLSYVQLAATKTDDGRLTAAEMFALPLAHARLVSLAACETGRVSGASAGEVMGMPRALIAAGADAVLLSHWRVDSEATLAWMRAFYAAAAESPLPAAARTATLTMRKNPAYDHPYYWGAFYLVGK